MTVSICIMTLLELQKNEPKPLKTECRAQKCTRVLGGAGDAA